MEINERILEELITIRKLLTVIAQDKFADFSEKIKTKYLTTEQRARMYDLFDGTRTLKEISEEVGVTSEAVRQFAAVLEKDGLLEYIINNKARCPKRLF